MDALSAAPGVYALVLMIDPLCTLQIGRLGVFTFQVGTYLYLGSARGPGGVAARVNRHLQDGSMKRKHWHVDWLRQVARPIGVIWTHANEGDECEWARALSSLGTRQPAGFGASDCSCEGHLIRLEHGTHWEHAIASLHAMHGKRLLHKTI
jgi:Uri superfamily endonuclease